jgi:predicted metal-dependent peptidase
VPTAGVCFSPEGKIIMVYNPDFINSLTLKEAQAVFIHEALHILYRHLSRFPFTKDAQINLINNLGTDMAINQYVENLPEGAVFPESFDLKRDENANYYIEELMKKKQKQQSGGGNGQGGDGSKGDGKGNGKGGKVKIRVGGNGQGQGGHEGWVSVINPDGTIESIDGKDIPIDYEVDTLVRKIADDLRKQGKLPGHLEKLVKDLQEVKKRHDWKSTLRIFVNSMLSLSKKLSHKRVNRRFMDKEYILPGKKKDRKPSILLARDTSGSLWDDKVQEEFLNEMINISKFCSVIVVDCDTQIHQEYKVKTKKDFRNYKGGGGTSFVPVFEKAKELNVDGIIYLTDLCGDFPKVETIHKYRTKTIWVTVDMDPSPSVPFGKVLNVDTRK